MSWRCRNWNGNMITVIFQRCTHTATDTWLMQTKSTEIWNWLKSLFCFEPKRCDVMYANKLQVASWVKIKIEAKVILLAYLWMRQIECNIANGKSSQMAAKYNVTAKKGTINKSMMLGATHPSSKCTKMIWKHKKISCQTPMEVYGLSFATVCTINVSRLFI
jgi:hypothetical protein